MKEFKNLNLKIQLTNEYLRTGGLEKITNLDLLQDIIDFDINKPELISNRFNLFMEMILLTNMRPPIFSKEFINEYDSIFQKALYFDQINIETEEEFDKLYNHYKNVSTILFRGQKEAKWRLQNTLQRKWLEEKLYETEDSYEHFLGKLIENGKIDYKKEVLENIGSTNIDTINSISILGFLQHHSCPTPLLDWTYKFQNALYFGIDKIDLTNDVKEINNYFSIYFIEENNMESGGMGNLISEIVKENDQDFLSKLNEISNDAIKNEKIINYKNKIQFSENTDYFGIGFTSKITKIKDLMSFDLSLFTDKNNSHNFKFYINNNKNILNQSGVFTWNSDSVKPIEVVGNEKHFRENQNAKIDDYRFSECYNINKELVKYISKRLADDGITNEYIYPSSINAWETYEKSKEKVSS